MKWPVILGVTGVLAVLVYVSSVFYPQEFRLLKDLLPLGTKSGCLKGGEMVEYVVDNKRERSTSTISVIVRDESNNKILREFTQPILQAGHYHPAEIHKCAAYFIQGFNYDPKSPSVNPRGFRAELMSLDYVGKINSLILLAEKPDSYRSYYKRDFRVDITESYVALEETHELADPTLVIRDIARKKEVLKLRLSEILKLNKKLFGDIMFLDWTRDGRYFWFSLFEAAYVNGWVRIDSRDWSYELFEAPEGVLGGYPLNIETGWVPLIPGAFWTGVVEFNQEIEQEREAMGHTADLYLYNVITKEKILVEDTNFPTWQGLRGTWLSDTELQYTMPDGTTKVYTITE